MAITCNCPGKCQIHPKYPSVQEPAYAVNEPRPDPAISAEDKLTLKTLEAAWLQACIDESKARQQIEMFGSALYEKLGISPAEWSLDVKKLTFTSRKA